MDKYFFYFLSPTASTAKITKTSILNSDRSLGPSKVKKKKKKNGQVNKCKKVINHPKIKIRPIK